MPGPIWLAMRAATRPNPPTIGRNEAPEFAGLWRLASECRRAVDKWPAWKRGEQTDREAQGDEHGDTDRDAQCLPACGHTSSEAQTVRGRG